MVFALSSSNVNDLGRDFATQAYKANSQIFDAIKWVAVLTGKYTDYCGTKVGAFVFLVVIFDNYNRRNYW